MGGGGVPALLSGTVCGLPAALSLKVRLALRAPLAEGAKRTPTVQLPLGARVTPLQLSLLFKKSSGLAPPNPTAVIVSAAEPVLVSVTDCGALMVPTGWPAKSKLVGLRLTAAA